MNEEIEMLYKKIDAQDKIINTQALEIAELNESITWWQNRFNAAQRDNRELKEENENLKTDYTKESYLVDKYTRQLTDEYENTRSQIKLKNEYKSRIDKALKELEYVLPVYTTPIGQVINLEDKLASIERAIKILGEKENE